GDQESHYPGWGGRPTVLRGIQRQVKIFSHMRLTTCLGLLSFALIALFAAPSAMADNCNAPPGTSGIDQYCESIPTPGGAGGGSHHGGGGGGSGSGGGGKSDRLSPKTTQTLKQAGAAGAAVLALTNSNTNSADTAAPAKAKVNAHRQKASKHKSSSTTTQTTTPSTTPPAAQDTVQAKNTSFSAGNSIGGALGIGFLLILAAIALLLGALAWLGRRRPEAPGA
ncbi:MAG TPA: hypothetical protein VIF57_27990, partial [Polyangia bacterium]